MEGKALLGHMMVAKSIPAAQRAEVRTLASRGNTASPVTAMGLGSLHRFQDHPFSTVTSQGNDNTGRERNREQIFHFFSWSCAPWKG